MNDFVHLNKGIFMKRFLVFVSLIFSMSAFANHIELEVGQQVSLNGTLVSCGGQATMSRVFSNESLMIEVKRGDFINLIHWGSARTTETVVDRQNNMMVVYAN